MELELRVTPVFSKNYDAFNNRDIRFIINQGSSRSSKTYSLCQLMVFYCLNNPNKLVSIVRKSFPSLRATVYRDMIEVLNNLNLYSEKYHNKTEHIYTFPNGSQIEFFSLDDSQKVRGRKRDVLWANEANEIPYESWMQLNMRTTHKMIADFNPSDTEHYLYDLMLQPNAIKIHSTYKDNTFLDKSIVQEIEDLIKVDIDYYNIYALGLPSKSNSTIYNHYQLTKELIKGETILGLDFGYQHPTALTRCDFKDNKFSTKELIYESHLTTTELIYLIKKKLEDEGLNQNQLIVCDYARPEIIKELNDNGLNCVNAIKNVKEGIDAVKSMQWFVDENSLNIKKELNNYKWKTVGERLTDEVVKLWDDAMDSIRYAVLYYKKNKGEQIKFEFVMI